jgi:hypothetical protein
MEGAHKRSPEFDLITGNWGEAEGLYPIRYSLSLELSANLPTQLVLRSFRWLNFLVVFESYSRGAVHLELGAGRKIHSLRARTL